MFLHIPYLGNRPYALEKLQPVYKVELKSIKEGFHWSIVVTLTKEQKIIIDLPGCSV